MIDKTTISGNEVMQGVIRVRGVKALSRATGYSLDLINKFIRDGATGHEARNLIHHLGVEV